MDRVLAIQDSGRAGSVFAVHVADDERVEEMPNWPLMARAALDAWARPLIDRGVPVQCEVVPGDPLERLPVLAQAHDALMIVVGKSGRRGWQAAGIGSTAEYLCEVSLRPIPIVPTQS